MVDVLYNVMARPIANEPDQKDAYHVDRAHRDAGIKKLEEDDPHQGGGQSGSGEPQAEKEQDKEKLEKELQPKKEGKGKYVGKDGKEHLDFYA